MRRRKINDRRRSRQPKEATSLMPAAKPEDWELKLSKKAQILALYHYRYTQANH